jgi:ribosomal protein L3 glutamine methyltransferase
LASGFDGLDFTRRLLQGAAEHLTEHGVLLVEVGNSAAALERAFPSVAFMWLEFAQGGDGVFLLTVEDLRREQNTFTYNSQL